MAEGLRGRMLMEHRDTQGAEFRFREMVLDLGITVVLQFQLRGVRRRQEFERDPRQGDLKDYFISISSIGDFLGTTPSYTSIGNLILRLCHRLIACSIAGRSQAPKKVTVTELFYLRGMDIDSVNVSYLLARLLTKKRLLELTVIRQPDAIDGALEIVEGTLHVDEGDQAVLAPMQAPQPPPPPAARTMPQKMYMLEEDVHEIRRALGEQREVLDSWPEIFPDSLHRRLPASHG
nr:hypothetical protein [Tanacetum cinerariifolium]